jgi:hypothetical protein
LRLQVIRDPRFESLTGRFDEKVFKDSYRFIYDEQLPGEKLVSPELILGTISFYSPTRQELVLLYIDVRRSPV